MKKILKIFLVLMMFNTFISAEEIDKEKWADKMKSGIRAFQDRDYDTAEKEFKDLLMMSPDDEGVMVLLAKTHLMQSELDAAFALLQKAISLRPDDANAYQYLSKIYEAMGDYPQAIGALETYIKYEKSTPLKKGAESYLEKLHERIKYAKSLFGNGLEFLKKKEFDRALKYFEEADKILPTIPGMNYIFGQIYFGKKDYYRAIQEFLVQYTKTPENIELILNIADAYLLYNDHKSAKTFFEKVLDSKADKDKKEYALKKIKICDDSIADIEEKKKEASYETLIAKGLKYQEKHLYHMALSHFDLALEKMNTASFKSDIEKKQFTTDVMKLKIVVLIKLQKYSDAVKSAEAHLETLGNIENPNKDLINVISDSLEILGKSYYFDKKFKNCADIMKKCIIINPNAFNAHYYIALMDIKRNDFENAKTGLKRVIEINPQFPDAYYNLAIMYEREDIDVCLKYLKKYNELVPENTFTKKLYDELTEHIKNK